MIKRLDYLLAFCFSAFFFFSCSQKKNIFDFIFELELKNGAYLVLLGSEDKMSNNIKKYNFTSDSKYNHVALLSVNNDQKIVYDMHPKKVKFTKRIAAQTLDDFIKFPNSEITHFSIWKISWLNANQLHKFIDLNLNVTYDYKFENKSDTSLYCSEFVAKTLDRSLHEPFDWIVLNKKLQRPENIILKKDSIEFFPVDFFLSNKNIVLIDQWKK